MLELAETSRIILAALPCSDGQVNLWAEVWAYDLDELDQAIAALTAPRPTFAAAASKPRVQCTTIPEPDPIHRTRDRPRLARPEPRQGPL